jgi:hypothetical protein
MIKKNIEHGNEQCRLLVCWMFLKCCSLYLLSWIDSVLAAETLVSGSSEHGRDFS